MFLLELLFDGIIDGWFALMQWIVPEKTSGKRIRMILKLCIEVFVCILFFIMVIAFLAILSDDPYTKQCGQTMIFISLTISVLQILFGIIVHIMTKKK